MDKIIILADHSGENQKLVACLSTLFRECEIQILSTPMEGLGAASLAPEPASADKGGKKNGKYLDRR